MLLTLRDASFGGWFVPFGSMAALGYLAGFHMKPRRAQLVPAVVV